MIRSLLAFFLLFHFHHAAAQQGKELWEKIDVSLQQKAKRSAPGDSIMVNLSFRGNPVYLDTMISTHLLYLPGKILTGKIRADRLFELAAHPSVIYIGIVLNPREELSTGIYDLTLNGISIAQERFPNINGNSIFATVKERSFDTTDIDLKGRVFKTGIENRNVTVHASLMATMIAGAGNSSPYGIGAAPRAHLGPVSFDQLLPETDSFYRALRISVQNHSYGTIVQNFYGNDAAAYDASANNIPYLLHVYSSGNSGTEAPASGPYAGIAGYGNLTGNVKEGKNLLVVGATDSTGVLQAASSRGPAHDGRIRPELVAFGEDGSSGAAALVSGAAILVQETYRMLHHDSLPPSSLVKAILVNSAEEAGAPLIDHRTGYGQLNAFKAIATVMKGSIHVGQVGQNGIAISALQVLPDMARLKLTLAWNDPAGMPGAGKSLVNDLDLSIKQTATGMEWLPWTLSHAPHRDSLELPAVRKKDTVNNVEQVTIDLPAAGEYKVEVKGSKVVAAMQEFSIAYSFDTVDHFVWTYPVASVPLIAGNTHMVRWQTNIRGSGTIESSYDGNSWQTLGNIADLSLQFFKWAVPDTLAVTLMRMRTGNRSFVSDSFLISPQPDLQVGYNCTDSFLLFWNRIPGATYQLDHLAGNTLQPAATTPDTSIVLNSGLFPSKYYSVRTLFGNRKGLRSATLNYQSASNGCYISAFYLQSQTQHAAHFIANLGTIGGVSKLAIQKLSSGQYMDLKEVTPLQIQTNFTDSFLVRGMNHYRLKVTLANGVVLYSNNEVVYHLPEDHPVIVFPNPLSRNAALQIINNESGRYSVQILDGQGRLLLTRILNTTITLLYGNIFSKGMYYLRIIDREGRSWTEKLVVN